MSYFKPRTWLDLIWHLLTIIALFTLLLYAVFNIFLPSYTNHGEVIEVPDLENKSFIQVKTTLEDQGLRWEYTDTVFSPEHNLGAVVSQHPKAHSEVKINRKIYLTMNAEEKEQVFFKDTNFVQMFKHDSYNNITRRLDSANLKWRKVSYTHHYKNYVGEIFYQGDTLRAGTKIPVGSTVTLFVSDGKGTQIDEPLDEEIDSLLFFDIGD